MEQVVGKGGFRKMYLAAAVCLFGAVGMGSVTSYSSMALPDMRRRDSRLHTLIDDDVNTWFGSLMAIGALVGGLIAGPSCTLAGRKSTLIWVSAPFTAGWMLICYSEGLAPLYIGRILTGLSAGMMCVAAPMYLVEIATPEIRGLFGTSFQLSVGFGILLAVIPGSFIRWSWLAVICAVPPIIMAAGMVCMPESPRWLVGKGRFEGASTALNFFHGEASSAETEIQQIQKSLEEQPKGKFTLEEIKQPAVWKSFIYSLALMAFQQFSGINAFVFYMVDIFEAAGSSLDSTVCTIIMCSIGTVFTVVSSLLIDRFGRKKLLMVSGVGTSIGLFAFATFDFIKTKDASSVAGFGWVPLACLVFYVMSFALGWGPIPWMMIPEMVPARVVGVVSGMATAFNWLCVFAVTKLFSVMQSGLQDYGTYWLYSAVCFGSCLFTHFFLPETKGKTFDEVQRLFDKKLRTSSSLKHGRNENDDLDMYS